MPEPLEQLVGHGGIEQRSARCNLPDAVDQARATDLLQQVARSACHHGGEQGLLVVVGGQDDAADLGVGGADVAAHVDAAAVGQPGVEQRHVRTGRGDAVDRIDGGGCLADDLDVVGGFEQVGQAAAYQLVVVED